MIVSDNGTEFAEQTALLDIVWSSGDLDVAVNELIQRGVELLVPCGSSASAAANRRTSTIPIVFINVGNPVGLGIVESLSRPGRNVTGFSDVLADLSGALIVPNTMLFLRRCWFPGRSFVIMLSLKPPSDFAERE
jgi:ABC-type uncharacterized transport system substrate-binding protein